MTIIFIDQPAGDKKKKVQVGKDQEKAQSEKYSHSKNQGAIRKHA